ncbi:MAG: ABC transporter permease [Gammaproteobacteria bacterium]|nr:ABC transporter permease [Gammaproteobacteria bacterium]
MIGRKGAFHDLSWRLPAPGGGALAVWRRNLLVWRKMMGASLLFNFGEPLIYLVGLGYGLGMFIGEMGGLPYRTFLATGLLASSSMTTASMEGSYSVYTRMVPQQTYDGMLATPLEVDDIVAGEMMWCATKGLISSAAILLVAVLLGAIDSWQALWCLPAFMLVGLCFAGPALLVASLARSWDIFAYYVTLAITPMFIFCGVFYPTSSLPGGVQDVVGILPLTHAVALIRPLAAGLPLDHVALHVAVLSAYALLGFYLAAVLTRRRLIA